MSNFDDNCTEDGSKIQPCDTASYKLTTYKRALYEQNFKIELLRCLEGKKLYNSFAARVSDTSLFIVIKYTKLKQKLIKNEFQLKN